MASCDPMKLYEIGACKEGNVEEKKKKDVDSGYIYTNKVIVKI